MSRCLQVSCSVSSDGTASSNVAPKTGDTSNVMLWVMFLAASFTGAVIILRRKKAE